MPFTEIQRRLLRVRPRRGGGYASYFGGDAAAIESAIADIMIVRGVTGRAGYMEAAEILADQIAASGSVAHAGDGAVGSYAAMNLAAHPIYSIDMALQDYELHYNGDGTGTGTATHHASGWWDGGAFCRMTPPTVNGLERGIAIRNMWRNATLAMHDVCFRFEWRGSHAMGSLWEGAKWILTHLRNTLTPGNAQDRAIYFAHLANAGGANSRANTILFAPAQGTVQAYGSDGYAGTYPPLSPWPNNLQSFYIADDDNIGGGAFNGRPLIPGSEILTFEMRVLSVATVEFPNGMIGMRAYRRNGQVLRREVPYRLSNNIDPPSGTLGSYFMEVQQLGCGQYNTAPTPNANLYMDVGGHITVARDVGGWLGPRAGFTLGA